jgi:hypothetical protein
VATALRLCFADVQALPDIVRGHGTSSKTYAVFLVSAPLVDVEQAGCDPRPAAG